MTTYNVSNLDSNASVVTVTSQGPQGADAVLQAGNRGDFTVAIAGNGSQTATINSGAVTSDKILDGTILNADINASAGILGTKISPNFGSQNITTTGNIAGSGGTLTGHLNIDTTLPTINLTDTNSDSDYQIQNSDGTFRVRDVTNSSNRLRITSDGTANFSGNLNVGAGLDITGDITVTGLVDSVDIATRDTLFGGLTSSSGVLTNGVTATTQSASDNSNKVATTAYTDTAISNLVDSSPAALNTLNELAAALGDDANFSTTVTNSIATKLSLSGGTIDGNVKFNDTKQLQLGSDSDLTIKHSGALADIVNTTGNLRLETGTNTNIIFRTDDNDTHTNIIICDGTTGSEHVDLYHSGNRRLATLSDGVRVVGKLQTGFEGDLPTINSVTRAIFNGSFDNTNNSQNSSSAISILCKGGSNSRINLGNDTKEDQSQIRFRNGSNDIQFLVTDPSDNELNSLIEIDPNIVKLNYAGSKKAETSATGFDITGVLTATGNIDLTDSSNILLGTDDDLDISHNGTVAKIKNSTGDFNIQGNAIRLLNQAGTETYLTGTANDALSLYFDGVEKAKTSADGFDITNGRLFVYNSVAPQIRLNTSANDNSSTRFGFGIATGSNQFFNGASSGDACITAPSSATMKFGLGNANQLEVNSTTIVPKVNIVPSADNSFALGSSSNRFTTLHSVDLNTDKAQTSSTGFTVLGQLLIQDTAPGIDFVETDFNNRYRWSVGGGILQLQISTNNGTSYSNSIGIGGVGNIFIPDGDKVYFGSGNDLAIIHDGTDSKITNNTGSLEILADLVRLKNNANDEFILVANANGDVLLFSDGSLKANTLSTGFEIRGDLKISGDIISEDKFITLANIATPTDTQASNSGLYIKGSTDKHFRYQNGNNSFNSTENITIAADKKLRFQSKFEIFNSSGIGHTAADFDSTANYSQNDYVKNGNKIYQAQASISAGGTAPTHANATVSNWLFVRIDDGELGQYIKDSSTGPLKLLSDQVIIKNTNDNKTSASFTTNGPVFLYNNNVLKLETTGNGITVTGTVTESSDVALKENIQPLSNVLEKVKQLTGYKYNFKNTNNNSMGVIAQDVEKVFPELVHGEEGEKSLQYSGLIGALIESIKELSAKVAVLEKQ